MCTCPRKDYVGLLLPAVCTYRTNNSLLHEGEQPHTNLHTRISIFESIQRIWASKLPRKAQLGVFYRLQWHASWSLSAHYVKWHKDSVGRALCNLKIAPWTYGASLMRWLTCHTHGYQHRASIGLCACPWESARRGCIPSTCTLGQCHLYIYKHAGQDMVVVLQKISVSRADVWRPSPFYSVWCRPASCVCAVLDQPSVKLERNKWKQSGNGIEGISV